LDVKKQWAETGVTEFGNAELMLVASRVMELNFGCGFVDLYIHYPIRPYAFME
jgi:hypothetical protein